MGKAGIRGKEVGLGHVKGLPSSVPAEKYGAAFL